MTDNKYSFKSSVRYSETDANGALSLNGIVNYIQDCSTFQSESFGLGVAYLKEKNRAWLLSGWNIVIDRQIPIGEQITVSTWAYDFKNIYGKRNFTIEDVGGNLCVKADSLWVYVNTDTRHPAKIELEDVAKYGTGEPLDMQPAVRKIAVPDNCIDCEPFKIKKVYLDTNGHVNNGWYIALAEEYLKDGFVTKNVKAVYQKEAVYGDEIYPQMCEEDGKTTVVFNSPEKIIHAVVEFYN